MCPETGLRDINKEIVTKIVPMRAVDLSVGPFCTELWCEHFCDDAVFWDLGQLLWADDINTEMVTIIAPVRAVDLSIGPFCTEFWCEQLFDEDIFREGVNFWALR